MAFAISDYNKFLKDPRSDSVTLAVLKGYIPSSPAIVISNRKINNGIKINASLKINSTNVNFNFNVYNPYDVRDKVNESLITAGITTVKGYLVRKQNGKLYFLGLRTIDSGISELFSISPPDLGDNALLSFILPIGDFTGKEGYTETFYLSSKQYSSSETDTPSNQQFDPILLDIPRQVKSVEWLNAGGKSDIGELIIKNKEGRLDYWSELYFKGEDVTILLGDVSWPLSNFYISPRFIGTFRTNPEEQNPEISDDQIKFKFGNRFEKLNKPLQANKYTDSDPEPGKEIPIAYGLVKNARPAITNEANQERQINDGEVNAIQAIYDGGNDVTGVWTINNSTGKATPGGGNKPIKTVTIDVQGIKDGATWLQYTGEIIKSILKRNGDFTDGDIDLDSLTALDTAKPYQIGLYVNGSDPVISIIDQLLDGIGAFRFVNYDNKLKFNLFKDPRNETPIAYFDDLNIIGNITVFPIEQVRLKTQLDGQRNWTVQDRNSVQPYISDPVSGGYDPDLLTWLENEYRTTTSTVQSVYPMSYTPPSETCFIVNEADVLTEANLRQAFFNQPAVGMEFIADSILFSLLPGDIINVVYSRHGMINGVNAQILDVEPDYKKREIKIKAVYFYE